MPESLEYSLPLTDGGQGGKYRLLSKEFDLEDLRLLAECVHATKFISKSKAKELVQTIGEFGSYYESDQLQEEVFLCDRVKSNSKSIMNNIAQINFAMSQKWDGKPRTPTKICFKYMKHTINDIKSQAEKRKGSQYIVSPFRLLINDGNYYLLAYSDDAQSMRTYRVDRMKKVEVLEEVREGAAAFKEIDMETYTQRVFSMFGGEQKRVKLKFVNYLLDTVIERFGTGHDTFYIPADDSHFFISTDVELSDQFYGWICGFRDKASIVAPEDVKNEMRQFLSDIACKYKEAES